MFEVHWQLCNAEIDTFHNHSTIVAGVTSDILAQRNEGRVLAVDRSRHAIEMAQRRFPALHLGVLDVSSPRLADSWRSLLVLKGFEPELYIYI